VAQKFDMERFIPKKLRDMDIKEQYEISEIGLQVGKCG
jgi:hypothetical protein